LFVVTVTPRVAVVKPITRQLDTIANIGTVIEMPSTFPAEYD
jgi:hypothetical protein